jgi:hypothetical protein
VAIQLAQESIVKMKGTEPVTGKIAVENIKMSDVNSNSNSGIRNPDNLDASSSSSSSISRYLCILNILYIICTCIYIYI